MRDVGDMYLKLEVPIGQRGHADGVVEIARGFAVNGDDGELAEIAASREFGFCDFLFFVSGFNQNFFGENMRQVMLANDDFDIHADFTRASENFQDASDGRETTFGVALDFHVHDSAIEFRKTQAAARERRALRNRAQFLAQSRRQLVAGGNQDFVQDARVIRKNHVSLRAVAKEADQRGVLAFDNLHHAAFGAAVRAAAFDASENAVAIHGVAEIVASDEKIAVDSSDRRIGDEKGVAFAMRNNSAGNKIRIVAAFRWMSRSWRLLF